MVSFGLSSLLNIDLEFPLSIILIDIIIWTVFKSQMWAYVPKVSTMPCRSSLYMPVYLIFPTKTRSIPWTPCPYSLSSCSALFCSSSFLSAFTRKFSFSLFTSLVEFPWLPYHRRRMILLLRKNLIFIRRFGVILSYNSLWLILLL